LARHRGCKYTPPARRPRPAHPHQRAARWRGAGRARSGRARAARAAQDLVPRVSVVQYGVLEVPLPRMLITYLSLLPRAPAPRAPAARRARGVAGGGRRAQYLRGDLRDDHSSELLSRRPWSHFLLSGREPPRGGGRHARQVAVRQGPRRPLAARVVVWRRAAVCRGARRPTALTLEPFRRPGLCRRICRGGSARDTPRGKRLHRGSLPESVAERMA
jgi:hypothetical protein